VPFTKIVTPAPTRWNSNAMMIKSVLKMRVALEEIRDDNSDSLHEKIPTKEQFEQLAEIEPLLSAFKTVSEYWSCDKEPSLHLCCYMIYNLVCKIAKLKNESSDESVVDFCNKLQENLDKYFPKNGTEEDLFALGNLFHPFFRGVMLRRFNGRLQQVKSLIVENHPSRQDFLERMRRDQQLQLDHPDEPLTDAEMLVLELSAEGNLAIIFIQLTLWNYF
jgi:hypothetical protein